MAVGVDGPLRIALRDDIDNGAARVCRKGCVDEVSDFSALCESEKFFLAFLSQDDLIIDLKALTEAADLTRIGEFYRLLLVEGMKEGIELGLYNYRIIVLGHHFSE